MATIQGYYNGTVCVPLESGQLFTNQKVVITALDEKIVPKGRKLGTLEGRASVSFKGDWSINDEELAGNKEWNGTFVCRFKNG